MSFIETYSGKRIDFFDPKPDQIDIEDIAIGLCRLPRFAGQTSQFYSVAQHSLNVARILPDKHKLQGLMHDAAEAFIGDLPTPFKRNIPAFGELESRIWGAICAKYNIEPVLHPLVKVADATMLVSERDVMKPAMSDWGPYEDNLRVDVTWQGWHMDAIKSTFLTQFTRLSTSCLA